MNNNYIFFSIIKEKEMKEKDSLNTIRERLLQSLYEDCNYSVYTERLLEEGIKSLFIVPIFFKYLGFDNIDDYQFETMPMIDKNIKERADITIRNKFIIETKKFNLLINKQEHTKATEQLLNYLSPEDNFEYGILTDGFTWELYLERTFIEKIANKSKSIKNVQDKIPLCLDFSLKDDDFWDWLCFLHKDVYESNMETLAKGIVNIAETKKGGVAFHHMFSKLKNQPEIRGNMGKKLSEQLHKRFIPIKGEYFIDIKEGKFKPGDKLAFDEDEYIKIVVTILEDGRLEIVLSETFMKPGNPKEFLKEYPKFNEYFLGKWLEDPNSKIYIKKIDIFKDIKEMGKKKTKWIKIS